MPPHVVRGGHNAPRLPPRTDRPDCTPRAAKRQIASRQGLSKPGPRRWTGTSFPSQWYEVEEGVWRPIEHLENFASIAGLEYVLIDRDTKLRELKQELRWNEIYYHLARGL